MTPEQRAQTLAHYSEAYTRLTQALPSFPKEMWQFKPTAEAWSVHETLIHITDSEANSYIRCRRCVAEPGQSVMAYDENQWARVLDYHAQDPDEALELFKWLRQRTYRLLLTLPAEAWTRTIFHPENGRMTLDDWLTVYARHIPDHLTQMQAVLAAWQACS